MKSQCLTCPVKEEAHEWNIYTRTGKIVHDTAFNIMGIYATPGFPAHMTPGKCINHVLQLVIKVSYDWDKWLTSNYTVPSTASLNRRTSSAS
jgi:hypothetical protein